MSSIAELQQALDGLRERESVEQENAENLLRRSLPDVTALAAHAVEDDVKQRVSEFAATLTPDHAPKFTALKAAITKLLNNNDLAASTAMIRNRPHPHERSNWAKGSAQPVAEQMYLELIRATASELGPLVKEAGLIPGKPIFGAWRYDRDTLYFHYTERNDIWLMSGPKAYLVGLEVLADIRDEVKTAEQALAKAKALAMWNDA